MPKQMTKADSSRIQSSQAKSGNSVCKNSFSSRAQSSADKSVNSGGKNSSPLEPNACIMS